MGPPCLSRLTRGSHMDPIFFKIIFYVIDMWAPQVLLFPGSKCDVSATSIPHKTKT